MAQEEIPVMNVCTCQQERGTAPLPAEGQQVRITLLKDWQSWEGNTRVVIPAGTSYEGTVSAIDTEGFFDMVDAAEKPMHFYIYDSTIQVENLSAVA